MCPTFHCNLTVRFTFNWLKQSNVEVTVKKNCKSALQLFHCTCTLGDLTLNFPTFSKPILNLDFYIELFKAIKCKPYSEITVETGTHLKTVKNMLNIFAV